MKYVNVIFVAISVFLYFGNASAQHVTPELLKKRITYKIEKKEIPSPTEKARYAKYKKNMDYLVDMYSDHAKYVFGVQVVLIDGGADGGGRGYAKGKNITIYGDSGLHVYMHELNHALGIGIYQSKGFSKMAFGRKMYGLRSTALAREFSGNPRMTLGADTHTFWPYGSNYPNEFNTPEKRVQAVKMMDAIWEDLRKSDVWTGRRIKASDGKCIGTAIDNNTTVIAETCLDKPQHAWDVYKRNEGTYQLKSITAQCLAFNKKIGSEVSFSNCTSADGKEDSIGTNWVYLDSGQFQNSANKNICLDVSEGKIVTKYCEAVKTQKFRLATIHVE